MILGSQLRKTIANTQIDTATGLHMHEVLTLLQAFFVRSGNWIDLDQMIAYDPFKRTLILIKTIQEARAKDPEGFKDLVKSGVIEFLKNEAKRRQAEALSGAINQ
jgi:hypothetical protein